MMASVFKMLGIYSVNQVRVSYLCPPLSIQKRMIGVMKEFRLDGLPVIQVPVRLQERIKRIRKKIEAKEIERRSQQDMKGNSKMAVIACKKQSLNHYKGQRYKKLDVVQLASQNWANKKSAGDFLTIKAFAENPANIPDTNADKRNFDSFGLRQDLVMRLSDCNINFPTNIQAMAISKLLEGGNAVCAAETGSGKTLAYLLPFIHNILEYKEVLNRRNAFCAPLMLIIVPGRELALQIKSVIDELTKSLAITSTVLIGGLGTKKMMINPPLVETDIVVTSLGVIRKLVKSDVYDISQVRHIVIDEADTMFDDSFNDELTQFLKQFKFRDAIPHNPMDPNLGVQMCLIGATLPRSLDSILCDVFPVQSLVKVTTPHLHRLMPHVPQKFLRLKKSEKPTKLVELVKADMRKKHNTIVFSKDSSTSDYVKMMLEENGIKCTNLNADMNAHMRYGRFQEFQDGLFNVMSCTDLASRGLDTIKVQHVINYDFPHYMSDYIHRAGRVGRINSVGSGHVTSLISSFYEIELVQKIEMAARKTEILPNVNANIKRKLMSTILGDDYM